MTIRDDINDLRKSISEIELCSPDIPIQDFAASIADKLSNIAYILSDIIDIIEE